LAVPSASCFLRRLHEAQGGADWARPTNSAEALGGVGLSRRSAGYARLSRNALEALRWFVGLATEHGVGRALWQPTAGVRTTDASLYGWGGHLSSLLPAAGVFSHGQRSQHINVKEVAALRFCLTAFGRSLVRLGGLLHVRVGNRVAMHNIIGFTSRSHDLMAELRRLKVVAVSLGVSLKAS